MEEDIRWKQRFQNYDNTFNLLAEALKIEDADMFQRAGMVQFFEMCFELSWKTMKDYLEEGGYVDLNSPRDVIKKAFEIGLIEEGHNWMDILNNRNLCMEIYDKDVFTKIEVLIRDKYFILFESFNSKFRVLSFL